MTNLQTRTFDASNYLGNEADILAYLQAAAEEGDPLLLAAALGDVAKARGMTQLAADTGLSRESLYKSLSGERAPSSDTLFKVVKALGLKISLASSAPS
jgi:probable addiction module antidote protein